MAEDSADLQSELFTILQGEHKTLQSEVDQKSEEIDELKKQISLVKEREVHYLHEINLLQSNEGFEVDKFREKAIQLEQEYSNLKKNFYLELDKHGQEKEQLQKQLEILCLEGSVNTNSTDENNMNNSAIFDENFLLEKELQTLDDDILEKRIYMDQLQKQNLKLSESVKNFQSELEQLNENINCKKQNIMESNDLINTMEDELFSIVQELDNLIFKCKKQRDSENSLFGEVNNKRLKLQEVLLDLTQKCDKMKLEVSNKQKQICSLKLHNDELTNIVKNDKIECKADQETLIGTYDSRIATLKNVCEKYGSIMKEVKELSTVGLPQNIVEFLNNLIEEKKKHEEKLNEEIGMEFRVHKMMSLELKEAYLKLQEWKDTTEQLKSRCLEHKETIQKLKQKNDDSNTETSISKIKKEIRSITIEHVNDENLKPNNNADERAAEKKVTFAEGTKTSSDNHNIVRKGGKIIQSKSVYIPSLIKKN